MKDIQHNLRLGNPHSPLNMPSLSKILNTVEGETVEPIAIVGFGGRFPGEATNPERLWELCSNSRSARSEVPTDRFNIDAFYHPQAERQGTINLRHGHFLKEDPASFDSQFFSITPNEVKAMDPQQRMALEVAYESIEDGKSSLCPSI